MTTESPPIPPPGYKLVMGEDIKDRVPEGALSRGANIWLKSCRVGLNLTHKEDLNNHYAIPSEPESITDEAKAIVAGERAADYGDAKESFSRIAKLWSAYTGIEITPWDVAQMMILLKVSRAKTSRKKDTLVDIIGYAECANQIKEDAK